ncbi:MAG: zinc-binding dehydrogenase [Caldilineaceae bacterium]|jgi:NADPH:quinone reductase-like Zn-dependent oxidoreductase|nr:zinc-binding dehydrogenase [Caldilineaceae bacterium]
MRAVIFDHHDPSPQAYHLVDTLPPPEVAADGVVIRVAYAALNRLDNFVRIGWQGLDLAWPHVPCSDFSGEIVAIGREVTGWRLGQRVTANPLVWCGRCRACLAGRHNLCRAAHLIGEHVRGACADYVAVPARTLVAIPDGYDMRLAAAASLVYVTAWHNLIVAGALRPGERVLVVGAGGGVNTAALQIAQYAGATVYVIASNAEKAARARQLGADWAYDRSQHSAGASWSRAVFEITEREGVDMVVDNVGEATWRDSLRALRPGGRLVTVGGTSGYSAQIPVNWIFGRHLKIIGSTMGAQDDYLTVMNLVFQDRLRPVIDALFPIEAFHLAIERLLDGAMFGKIVIAINPTESTDSETKAGKS